MASSEDLRTAAYNEYFLFSGALFFSFARAESTLAATLRVHIAQSMGDSEDYLLRSLAVAAAILGNARYNSLKDTFKRLLKLQDPPDELQAYVDKLFSHIGDIQFLRDRLAHNLVSPFEKKYNGTWITEDYAGTKDFNSPKAYTFEISALKAAFFDLNNFCKITGGILSPLVIERSYPFRFDLSPPPWQYKASMLVQHEP